MTAYLPIRLRAAAMLAGISLLLSGCFLSPGKFASELQLLEDNQFTFSYDGEVYFFGLAQLADMRNRSSSEFTAYCYGPVDESAAEGAVEAASEAASDTVETLVEEAGDAAPPSEMAVEVVDVDETYSGSRECTPEEEAEQRAEWEERQASRKERDREQAKQFGAILGGIDPTDPKAADDLAAILTRQEGFESVVHKGDGLFDVKFSISGTLSHDFMFPSFEGFPTTNAFVQIHLRKGGVVRVNAPGLAPQSASNPLLPLMSETPMFGRSRSSNEPSFDFPVVEGTFSIVTNGEIRANNTDEGPVATESGQRLTWNVTPRSKSSPTALIAMPE